jgi:hypothetical protein
MRKQVVKLRWYALAAAPITLMTSMAGEGAWSQGTAQPAPPQSVDPRVEAALKAAGLDYSLDEGDFRLEYDVDEARSQRVWVASGTARIDQLEIRDVWSVAARGKGEVPADLARTLLKENVRMILGAWQVNQSPEEYLVVYSAQVAAAADAATLQKVIEVVMFSADRIEKQLSDKDTF